MAMFHIGVNEVWDGWRREFLPQRYVFNLISANLTGDEDEYPFIRVLSVLLDNGV